MNKIDIFQQQQIYCYQHFTSPYLNSMYVSATRNVMLSTTTSRTWSLIPSIIESLSSTSLWTSVSWLAIPELKLRKHINMHLFIGTIIIFLSTNRQNNKQKQINFHMFSLLLDFQMAKINSRNSLSQGNQYWEIFWFPELSAVGSRNKTSLNENGSRR